MKNLIFLFLLVAFGASRTYAQVALNSMGSTSVNSYGGFTATKHTLSYNPDLNLLVFGHRGGGVAGGTGNQIYYDYSTDGGATWTPQVEMTNPTTNLPRYPQMCIWNPAGNTNIANAMAVTTGPTNNTVGWNSSYLAWANLSTTATATYTFQTTIPNVVPASIDFASWAMCNLNGGMGYVAARMDSAAQTQNYHSIDFWKIVPDGNGGFTRSIKFTSAPVACAAADTASFCYDMAFGPDGNTGYISHTTADISGQKANDYSRTPILYKTTDAGETWTKQNFIDLHAIQMILDSTTVVLGGSGEKRPAVTDSRIVVDNLGRCHLFAEISSGITTCTDSITFTNPVPSTRFVVHFIINGNSVQTNFVYRNQNSDTDFGALIGAFDAQYQAARSADGKNVFFTTLQTPTNGIFTDNNYPNLLVYALRTTDNMYMSMRNMTEGSDADGVAFFPRLSPVVMNTANGHKLPITLMIPGTDPVTGSISETSPPSFFYLEGIEITAADYTNTMPTATTLAYNANGSTACNAGATCQTVSGGTACTLTASATSTPVSCYGLSNGLITVTATGGTGWYNNILPGGCVTNTPLVASAGAGTYTITVTDAVGCTTTVSAVVTQPAPLTVMLTNISEPSCFGGTNGSATVNATGGTAPYIFIWDNAQQMITNTNLAAGLHTVTVTDMNSCTTTGSIMMTEPTAVGGTVTMTQQATCSDANGAAAVNAHGGIPPHTYAWSNSNSLIFNPNNLTAGTNTVTITDTNGCTGFATVTIIADLTGCVFPGDANNDGIANNADLLPIALSNALTGTSRANASTQWLPQTAQNWTTTIPNTTTNTKHADCDGDGVVTANDTLAILQNYGQTHQRDPHNEVWHNNSPTISCAFPSDTVNSTVYPYTLRSNIMVGDAITPATDITGLAFTINYDATIASSAYMLLSNMSWLGAPNELYHLYHDDGQGHIDIAISRFDGTTRNGMGAVASCNFVITDNVIGRGVNNANYNFNVSVSGIKAINNQNIPKTLNGADSHTTMQGMVLGTTQNNLENAVRVFPNPLNGNILTIKTDNLKCTNAVLHNVLGQAVFSTTLNNDATHNLTLTDLTNGVYTLTLSTDKGNVVRKVIVAR